MNEEIEQDARGDAPAMGGVFATSLKRNFRQIKSDRAEAITEDTELDYKRQVEDTERNLKRMRRQRDNMLDLAPATTTTLQVAEKFDAAEFVEKDIQLSVDIRNTEIQLQIAKARYNHLFGGNL